MNLKNANIVLTGASSGIGKELLDRLMEYDCTIVATARTMEEVEAPERKNVYFKNFDLKHPSEIDGLFDYAFEKMGRIDLFIANAGFMYYEKIDSPDYEHIEEIFRVNTTGAIYAAVKMKEICGDRPYNFVAVSSGFGFISYPGYALYCSTKAALRGFGQGYKYELKPNQHYQSVYPIAVKTDFFRKAGCDAPPKPQQSVKHVAKTILRGIEKDKGEIYPSKSFWFMKTFMPYLLNLGVLMEKRKFRKNLP
ncbi:SDR family NAD(P)-dependent oxidoreductase [Isachenkonia alkalipeptolytica]|nr:SDR family NAD(P)-dependent oxidoreductase [Isachenkonia alkalipeptolytica]